MKNLLMVALLVSGSAMGQKRIDTVNYPNEKMIIETDSITTVRPIGGYMFNKFLDNWFVFAGVGAQMFYGNQDYLKPMDKRLTPTYEGGFGKWLHPDFGLRAKMGGGLVKSYSTGTLPFEGKSLIVGGPDEHGVYQQRWHDLYGEIDFMVDLSNIIGGYKPARFYSAIPYLGAGVDFVQQQPKHNADRTAMGILGLINRFRLGPNFDANLELKGAIVKQTFDREISGLDFEALTAVSVGITYRFGKAGTRLFRKGTSTNTVVERRLRNEMPAHADTVYQTVRDSTVGPTHILTNPVAVFFELDKAEISGRAKVNLAFVADIIKNSKDAKFMLTGSADSRTATPEHNLQLSVRRSQAVRDYLVQVLMVDPNQLIPDPVGGSDRFKPAKVNRTVIISQQQQ